MRPKSIKTSAKIRKSHILAEGFSLSVDEFSVSGVKKVKIHFCIKYALLKEVAHKM